jgi:uroporphyrinogen decarboxylase
LLGVPSSNSAFLTACRNETPDFTPVWFMRQAGRSLPEYRQIRGTGSILDAIAQPDLVTEITLQPVRRYGVDAAILYSDIMVPLHAIGFGVDIKSGIGPVVDEPFRSESDLQRIRNLEPEVDTPYVLEAVKTLVGELDIPLIGFAGAPFTLASYLIEGGPSKNYATTKAFMYEQPDLWTRLMDRLADLSITSLRSQVQYGAQAVQVFDSWAGSLSRADYERFVMPATTRVFASLQDVNVPRIHFGVGTGELLTSMSQTGADVIGIDWRVSLPDAQQRVGNKPVQGNLDPAVCLSSWETVAANTNRVLDSVTPKGHIFNLGHGVLPDTDPDVLKRLTDYVHTRQRG